MTGLEERLKEDAARIEAQVPPRLASRIADAVRRTRRSRAGDERGVSFPLWLAGSVTGVAAAVLVIALVNRTGTPTGQPDPSVARAVPEYVRRIEQQTVPLHAETAELTGPLEEELDNLRSDIEKARENVERDLAFTF